MKGNYLLMYRTPSHWGSCRIISKLLERNYQDYLPLYQEDGHLPDDLKNIAIIDHRWLTDEILESLPVDRDIRVEWYVFGDFTLRCQSFRRHLSFLSKYALQIIVASEAQKSLVTTLFPEAADLLVVREYPIDPRFKRTEEGRQEVRESLGVSLQEKLWGYVGRISPQKGILELMDIFLRNAHHFKGKLLLVGPLDPHAFWQFSDQNELDFPQKFKKLLLLAGEDIIWRPWVNPEELPAVYSALDLFISPSAFHDEDFGLTPSEALACGVNCLLTNWGGYKRFKGDPRVQLVSMEASAQGYRVDTACLQKALLGEPYELRTFTAVTPLLAEERRFIIEHEKFLNQDGKFDWDLYRKLYQGYVYSFANSFI